MLKNILKLLLALALAFVAYLFFQAYRSEDLVPATIDGAARPVAAAASPEVLTIAFGSCNRSNRPQDYWSTIVNFEPYAWLWLGDNVYADTDDMEAMAADYRRQKEHPEYAAFTAAVPRIYGTWDDHDYGSNDAGAEWPHKQEAGTLLLDFLDVPADAPVRNRPGVYQAYTVEKNGLAVRVILLDTRSFRDALAPPTKSGHRYGANPEGSVLGDPQFAWLEEQLTAAGTHDFTVIASSIQVLPEEHGYEKWANFPAARAALLDALTGYPDLNVVLLSGDRHLGEISRLEHRGKIITEITASGLTHSYESADEPNAHRVSPLIGSRNFGVLHFAKNAEGTGLLAEIRTLPDGELAATTALGNAGLNTEDLAALIHQNETVTEQLKPCPDKPNCVSTQATQPDKKREPLAYTGSLADAKARLKNIIGDMSRTRLVNEEENYLHFTFKTFPIPFIDDVEFLFDDDAKVIHYRSASRVGHSDLGVNSRRMQKVATAWNE